MASWSGDDTRPRFELSEVHDDGSTRAEVCSLQEIVGRVGDVALSRRAFWGLSAFVGGGLLAACAPASEQSTAPKATATAAPAVTATSVPAVATTKAPTTSAPASPPAIAVSGTTCNDRLAHGGPVIAVALSPDGTLVASVGPATSGAAGSGSAVKLWRASDGTLLQTLKGREDPCALAFSPDGQVVAAGGANGTVYLWKTADGGALRELSWQPSSNTPVSALAFSPDGKLLAATDVQGRVGIWDATTGDWKRSLSDGTLSVLLSLAFSPDGKVLAVGTVYPGIVRFWDVADGARRSEQAMDEIVLSLAWSPDGRRVAVGGVRKVFLLDATTGKPAGAIDLAGTEPGASSLAFAKNGASIFVGQGDGGLGIGAIGGTSTASAAHTAGPTKLALDRGGTRLVTAGGDGRIRLWDIATTVRSIERCFADPSVPASGQLETVYGTTDANGVKRTYNIACGAPIPPAASCTCNCVPSLRAGSTPAPSIVPVRVTTTIPRSPVPAPAPPQGGSVPGGSYCTCNKVCTCVPVRKYCFVMWR
jgi:WD40 repeat protein